MKKSRFKIGIALAFTLLISQLNIGRAIAHRTGWNSSGSIQATVHVEPGDAPVVGVSSLVWVRVFNAEDQTYSKEDFDLSLAVYRPTGELLIRPALDSVTAEGRSDLLGTHLTFPIVGSYRLLLQGQPKREGLEPFQFEFSVTVAARSGR